MPRWNYSLQFTITYMRSQFVFSNRKHLLCLLKLIVQHQTPLFQRHGALCVYYFPKRHQITLRCVNNHSQVLHTLSITGSGLLHKATGCYVNSDELQIFPELYGMAWKRMSTSILYLPDNIPVVSDDELQQLNDKPPLEIQKMNDIHDSVTTPLQTYDIESLLHARQISLLQEKEPNVL